MTGDKSLFVDPNLTASPLKYITFGDNNKGKVIGLGKIAISKDKSIDDVLLVQSLGFNLMSVGKSYLLSMRWFSLEEERVMQQSSVSISLTF